MLASESLVPDHEFFVYHLLNNEEDLGNLIDSLAFCHNS